MCYYFFLVVDELIILMEPFHASKDVYIQFEIDFSGRKLNCSAFFDFVR